MKSISLHQKQFDTYISSDEIENRVSQLATAITSDLEGKNPLFVGILNGSFRFASDLFKYVEIECEINFVKISSYRGTESTGEINELISLDNIVENRHIVIVEDIVDTGNTLEYLMTKMKAMKPESIRIASLLYKPEAYQGDYKIDYIGFEIPNLFVVGYGLDYDGQGRNLNDIYQIQN